MSLVLYAVSYTNSLCRNASCSPKIFLNSSMSTERLIDSFGDLWAILLSVAKDKDAGEIVCILDAIDECEDHGRSRSGIMQTV